MVALLRFNNMRLLHKADVLNLIGVVKFLNI